MSQPGVLARRHADRLHGAVRGQRRRLRRAGRGRRADAPHLAPGARHRAGVHARRIGGAVHLGARASFTARYHAALHRAGEGRRRDAARDSERVPRRPTRPTASGSPTTRSTRPSPSGSSTAAARISRSGSTQFGDHAVEKVPQPPDRSNDVDPMWIGDTVYFRSDRDGEFNLFSFDTQVEGGQAAHQPRGLPGPGRSAGGGKIVYEQAGYLHLLDPANGPAREADDRRHRRPAGHRPRFAKGARYIRDASLSPSGARAVFEFRGEIVTVPAEKGDPRNLTNTTGAHERSPVWSPDGKSIAYFSDEAASTSCVVAPPGRQGRGPQDYKLTGRRLLRAARPGRRTARRSPTPTTRGRSSGSTWQRASSKKIASETGLRPVAQTLAPVWSPDSKWIAYTLEHPHLHPDRVTCTRSSRTSRSRSPTA